MDSVRRRPVAARRSGGPRRPPAASRSPRRAEAGRTGPVRAARGATRAGAGQGSGRGRSWRGRSPGRSRGPGRRSRSVLEGESRLAVLARRADLTQPECEVLGLLCAIELDPRRERLVGYLSDDVTQRRMSPWTLRQVFAPDEEQVIAVGPSSGLRRAALLAPPADGPWAAAPVTVASTVMWWLAGAPAIHVDLPAGIELLEASGANATPATARRTGPQVGRGGVLPGPAPSTRRRSGMPSAGGSAWSSPRRKIQWPGTPSSVRPRLKV